MATSLTQVLLANELPASCEGEALVRLTPQGLRLATRLEMQTPRERERTMRKIFRRRRKAKRIRKVN